MSLDPTWLALIGALFGGTGLKIIDHQLNKRRDRTDDAARIRDELRIEINSQREEISALSKERDKWRDDYYNLRDEVGRLATELTITQRELEELRKS